VKLSLDDTLREFGGEFMINKKEEEKEEEIIDAMLSLFLEDDDFDIHVKEGAKKSMRSKYKKIQDSLVETTK
jgi:threonine synthase